MVSAYTGLTTQTQYDSMSDHHYILSSGYANSASPAVQSDMG